ncbi:MAG: hypothetical protein NVS3B20_22950 [Polyangiales bacterium]
MQVNPMNKRELPSLPEGTPKKVPVLELDGEVVADSTKILHFLDQKFPDQTPFFPTDEAARAKTDEIERWVDDVFTFALPTVIYGKWGEAIKAAQVTARTSNFGFVQNAMVRAGGSIIMHEVSKRILKKHGKTDGAAWVAAELDRLEGWLGDQPFVCGDAPSLGDAAAHGAISCTREFPIHQEVMRRPRLAAWFQRVEALRAANRAV